MKKFEELIGAFGVYRILALAWMGLLFWLLSSRHNLLVQDLFYVWAGQGGTCLGL